MTEAEAAIGPRLRAERERRGLSAQKAADALHLDGWVIEALESGDYARLGAPVYAKGHLKRYAAFLELPPAEPTSGVAAPPPAPAPTPVVDRFSERPRSSSIPRPAMLGGLAAVLLIGAVAWLNPWHRHAAPAGAMAPAASATEASAASPTEGEGAAAPAADPATLAASPTAGASPTLAAAPAAAASPTRAVASPAAAAPGSAAAADAAGTGHAKLRLSFSADSWVDVHDASGRRAFAGNGRANSVKIISGAAPMRVYLGFASGVQLEINSRAVAIGPQFVAGDVARFEAGADGVLRRDSHAASTPAQARNARPTG